MKNIRWQFYLVGVVVLVAITAAISGWFYYQSHQNSDSEDNFEEVVVGESEIDCENVRKIDGTCYEGDGEPSIYTVMIENHVDARPLSGLSQASLIYEAIVEAPITRFLVVFSTDKDVDKIGPVRSARPFYVDWTKEFNSVYAHVGGSPEGLEQLKGYDFDLNEFYNGNSFWRAWNRSMPHNVYTSSEKIHEAIEAKGWELSNDYDSWLFKKDEVEESFGKVDKVKVDYATESFEVLWEFSKESNDFLRYQAGRVHVDSQGYQVRAKNVAIMYTESTVIDDYGRRKTVTVGSGEAEVFLDGQMIEAKWQRPSLNDRTKFYSETGEEIKFNVGATWIQVVPEHFAKTQVTYTN
jgi:hypothetical protein